MGQAKQRGPLEERVQQSRDRSKIINQIGNLPHKMQNLKFQELWDCLPCGVQTEIMAKKVCRRDRRRMIIQAIADHFKSLPDSAVE